MIHRIRIHNTIVYLVELLFLIAGFMEGYLMKKGRENKETQNLWIRIRSQLKIHRIRIHYIAVYLVELLFLVAGFMEDYLMKKGRENKETQNLRFRIQEAN
jgi:hypothetical protein